LNLLPEGVITATTQHMTTKLEKMGRPRELAANMLVRVKPLANKEVNGREHGHVDAVEFSLLQAFQQ
jgi:hypothetical protein